MLKDKIAKTPILKHFDPDRAPVIVLYASKWAVSAALLQKMMELTGLKRLQAERLKPTRLTTEWWKTSIGTSAYPGYRVHCAVFSRDKGIDAPLDVFMSVPIFRSEWEAREMGGVGIKLDVGGQKLRKGKR